MRCIIKRSTSDNKLTLFIKTPYSPMQNDVIVDPVRQEVLMIQPLSYLIMDKKKHFDCQKS